MIVDLWTDNIYSFSVREIKDYCIVASHESSAVMPKQPAATGINHGCRISNYLRKFEIRLNCVVNRRDKENVVDWTRMGIFRQYFWNNSIFIVAWSSDHYFDDKSRLFWQISEAGAPEWHSVNDLTAFHQTLITLRKRPWQTSQPLFIIANKWTTRMYLLSSLLINVTIHPQRAA